MDHQPTQTHPISDAGTTRQSATASPLGADQMHGRFRGSGSFLLSFTFKTLQTFSKDGMKSIATLCGESIKQKQEMMHDVRLLSCDERTN
jgi:hypothetical protein